MKYSRIIITITLLLTAMVICTVSSGCGPHFDATVPPPFTFDIGLPMNQATALELTLEQGESYSLPVTINSNQAQDLAILLQVSLDKDTPQGIVVSPPEGDVLLPAEGNVTVEIAYLIGYTVTPGRYHTALSGTSGEPVQGIARSIDIIIIEKQ